MKVDFVNKLNAAIIGCGAIHDLHADGIINSGIGKIAAVVDIDEEKAKQAALKYDCEYYFDYHDVLKNEDVDVIHICTPHYLHAPMAIDAMNAQKHVLVEKPLALNTEQAYKMIETSDKNDVYFGIAYQNRYNNTSLKLQEVLKSGVLGKIKGLKGIVTWHRTVPYYEESGWRGKYETEGGGVMINQAIHTLDLMQWFGGQVEAVKGHIDTRVLNGIIEVEDTADATLYFKNGAVGIFYATNCYTTNSPVEIEVHCENGTLSIMNNELILSQDGKTQCLTADRHNSPYKSYWGVSHAKLIYHFYNSIVQQLKNDYIHGKEGVEALKIIEGIHASSVTGEKIFIH